MSKQKEEIIKTALKNFLKSKKKLQKNEILDSRYGRQYHFISLILSHMVYIIKNIRVENKKAPTKQKLCFVILSQKMFETEILRKAELRNYASLF